MRTSYNIFSIDIYSCLLLMLCCLCSASRCAQLFDASQSLDIYLNLTVLIDKRVYVSRKITWLEVIIAGFMYVLGSSVTDGLGHGLSNYSYSAYVRVFCVYGRAFMI